MLVYQLLMIGMNHSYYTVETSVYRLFIAW
jgi:hypothetical protein